MTRWRRWTPTFAGTFDGPMYTRYGNPTVSALEAAVAASEGGEAALAYGSGTAAIHGALRAVARQAGPASWRRQHC